MNVVLFFIGFVAVKKHLLWQHMQVNQLLLLQHNHGLQDSWRIVEAAAWVRIPQKHPRWFMVWRMFSKLWKCKLKFSTEEFKAHTHEYIQVTLWEKKVQNLSNRGS